MADALVNFVSMYNSIELTDYVSERSMDIYHYTSPGGLSSIIGKGKLRFTDRLFLNDKSEGTYVLQLYRKVLNDLHLDLEEQFYVSAEKSLEKTLNEFDSYCMKKKLFIYQCSFSCDQDSLCLWNYYTKGDSIKGYNIHFKSKALCEGLVLSSKLANNRTVKPVRGKVIYNKNKQTEIVTKIVQIFHSHYKTSDIDTSVLTMYLIDKLLFIGIFFKDSCFQIENEYRIALPLYVNDDWNYVVIDDKPNHFERNGILIPYIDVGFQEKSLIGIGLSPTTDVELAVKSVQRVGAKYSCLKEKANIVRSKIPVRY